MFLDLINAFFAYDFDTRFPPRWMYLADGFIAHMQAPCINIRFVTCARYLLARHSTCGLFFFLFSLSGRRLHCPRAVFQPQQRLPSGFCSLSFLITVWILLWSVFASQPVPADTPLCKQQKPSLTANLWIIQNVCSEFSQNSACS